MVKTGQNFRFGFYDKPILDRMKAIKNAGFNDTMIWWGDEFDEVIHNDNKYFRFDMAMKAGLGVNTIHFPSTHADWLWYDDEKSSLYVKQALKAIDEVSERGVPNLVIHMTRSLITPSPNIYGINNFKVILEKAEDANITLAIENTRFLEYNTFVYSSFNSKALGFCYDTGHNNCYTPGSKPLDMFSKYLSTTHIHDNHGPISFHPDEHHLMGEGNVDFDPIFEKLKQYNCPYYNLESYCDEKSIYHGKVTMEEFLEMSYRKLTYYLEKNHVEYEK